MATSRSRSVRRRAARHHAGAPREQTSRGTFGRDVQAFVFKRPAELAADVRQLERDVRKRADAAVKGLEARGALVVGAVERQLAKASNVVAEASFRAASQTEVGALARRRGGAREAARGARAPADVRQPLDGALARRAVRDGARPRSE